MENVLQLMEDFERKNNLSVQLIIQSDGSSSLEEFWNNEEIKSFDDLDSLKEFLEKTNLKKDEEGFCVSPIEII